MDNKRVYRKIATIFWFLFAIMPIISSLIQSCIILFNSFDSVTLDDISSFSASNMEDISFMSILYFQLENAYSFATPSFLRISLYNLFNLIDNTMSWGGMLSSLFSWFIWVYILELLIDIFVWLPKFIHRLLEKYGGVE